MTAVTVAGGKDGRRSPDLASAPEPQAWLDATCEFVRAVNGNLPFDDLLNLIAGTVVQLTSYDFCSVMLPDELGERLLIRGFYGLSPSYVAEVNAGWSPLIRPGELAEGPSSRAFRTQRPVVLTDIRDDPTCAQWEAIARKQGYRSILSLPLVASEGSLGVLTCYTRERREFTTQELVFMEAVASHAALAIESSLRRGRERARISRLQGRIASLEEEHRISRQSEEVYHELMRMLLAGEGLEPITRRLAAVLKSDVLVRDPTGHSLSTAVVSGHLDETSAAAVYQDPVIEAQLRQAHMEHRAVELRKGDGSPAVLVAPVILDDEVAGQVWAFNPRQRFGALERGILERGALVVALALSRMRVAQEVEWRLSGEFLDDLLAADVKGNRESTIARARQLGLDLTLPYTLLLVRPDPVPSVPVTPGTARLKRSLLTQVQRVVNARGAGSSALVAARAEDVVVLWPQCERQTEAVEFAELLRRQIRVYTGSVSVGLGPLCRDVAEYATAYRLAVGALDLVHRAGGRERVVTLEELGIYRPLLQVKRPEELIEFMRSVLQPLYEYDRHHGTTLTETLRAFLRCGFSTVATAKALAVHPNTVGYRLRRIEEILGVDSDDAQTLLQFQFAFLIESVLGGRPGTLPASVG